MPFVCNEINWLIDWLIDSKARRPRTRTVQLYSPGCANASPVCAPQLACAPYPCSCSLLSGFEYIDLRTYPTVSWLLLFALKNTPSCTGTWTPSNTWFIGPTQVHSPNGISIGSVAFAGRCTCKLSRHSPFLGLFVWPPTILAATWIDNFYENVVCVFCYIN